MINVNLLPHHLRPIKRTPLPYILSLLAVAGAVAVMGSMFVSTQARIMSTQGELTTTKEALAKLKPIMDEYEQLQKDKQLLATKIATINEIVKDRIIWSRQLWNLSRLAPPNLWFSGVKVEIKVAKEQRTGKDPKTGEPKTETVMVKYPVMTVSGYVVAMPSAPADVYAFAQPAQQDGEFSNLFSQVSMVVQDTEFEGNPVKKFDLGYRVVPGAAAK